MAWKNKYVKWGLTVFCTVSALLLFSDTLFGSHTLLRFVKKFFQASQPVIYAAAMAYLLVPLINFFDRHLMKYSRKPGKNGRPVSLGVRSVSIFLTWTITLLVLYLFGRILIPELYKSMVQLVANVENYYNNFMDYVHSLLERNPTLEQWVMERADAYYGKLEAWFERDLLPQATNLMGAISGGVLVFLGFVGDLLVGMIVSVYFMASKEACAAYCSRLVHGLFSEKHVYWILRGTRKVDIVFSGFVRGKILDSAIIGVLCFIGCSALAMPYTSLVSIVVGVTNVIPFFGPFLGAIPSAFLILLVDLKKGFYFILFVLALQQLDGNVIGPKILGDKTGLSSLWVIFAILVGGSFFGVAGMFFAVPVCACFYSAVNLYTESRLAKKNLPMDSFAYLNGQVKAEEHGKAPEESAEP